jgi:hypothetical protein
MKMLRWPVTHEDVLPGAVQANAVIIIAILGGAKRDCYVLGKTGTYESVVCNVELE